MHLLRNIVTNVVPKKFLIAFIVAVSSLIVSACGSDSNGQFPDVVNAEVRVLHAVADAPLVNVYVNEEQVLSGVDFRVASGFIGLLDQGKANRRYDIRVEAIRPAPLTNLDVIDASNVAISRNSS